MWTRRKRIAHARLDRWQHRNTRIDERRPPEIAHHAFQICAGRRISLVKTIPVVVAHDVTLERNYVRKRVSSRSSPIKRGACRAAMFKDPPGNAFALVAKELLGPRSFLLIDCVEVITCLRVIVSIQSYRSVNALGQ